MARSVALTLRNDGRFSPVRVAYRTKYAYSNAHGASASPHACLRYTSETITGADIKAKVFSRQRKYIRQTNDVSDQRKMFAVAGATFDGVTARDDAQRAWLPVRGAVKTPSVNGFWRATSRKTLPSGRRRKTTERGLGCRRGTRAPLFVPPMRSDSLLSRAHKLSNGWRR